MAERYVYTPTRFWAVLEYVAFMEADGTLRFLRYPDAEGAKRVAKKIRKATRRARRAGQ